MDRYNAKACLLGTAILAGLASTAHATCPQDGAKPMHIGPHNPQTTFPLWVQDSEGLALEMCPGTDQVNCISVPPFTPLADPGLTQAQYDLSAQIGFGDEGFYASADALMTVPAGGALATAGRARLVTGLEAAFLPDFNNGNQFPFTRLRIRIDVPQTGTYIVTHPWGQITYNITTAGVKAINDSFDIPFFAGQTDYLGRIGPILTWDTYPADPLLDQYGPPFQYDAPYGLGAADGMPDYVGIPTVTHKVKGSPCGTNVFRIDGPNIGGSGINTLQTDLFTVTGKVYTGAPLPTPLRVEEASYGRWPSARGLVQVFATAPASANLHFSGGANIPPGNHALASDGTDRHFGVVAVSPDSAVLPATIDVVADDTANNPSSAPTTISVPLVDLVSITRAEYVKATGVLTVEASSSDLLNPPTLTALGQTLSNGVLTTSLPSVPARITVTSSAGGSASYPVTVINPVP